MFKVRIFFIKKHKKYRICKTALMIVALLGHDPGTLHLKEGDGNNGSGRIASGELWHSSDRKFMEEIMELQDDRGSLLSRSLSGFSLVPAKIT